MTPLVPRVCRPRTAGTDAPAGLSPAWQASALIGLLTAFNLAYLLVDCPLDLAPDEAHYWHWSRHLDWSYYSKGPLVAWLIRAGCELFGGLSVALVGTEMVAVRMPAVISSALFLAGVYVLSAEALGSRRVALATLGLAVTLPPVMATGMLMTIDPPYLAAWCWALVFARRAVEGDRLRDWAAAGACCAVGVLAKFPILLLPAAVGGYLLFTPALRPKLKRAGFWLMCGLMGVGCLPIVIWNAAHDWVSVRHVLGLVGASGPATGAAAKALGPLAFLGGQAAFLLGVWLVAFLAAAWVYRPWRNAECGTQSASIPQSAIRNPQSNGLAFLWWTSVPVWGVFFVTSVRSVGEMNWPAAAYVAGLPLCVAWLRRQLDGPDGWYRRAVVRSVVGVAVLGVVVSVVLHYFSLVRPLAARLAGPPSATNPAVVRRYDPTSRLLGWRTLAAEVDRLRDKVKAETGEEPVVAAAGWNQPGELSFYCKGHPETYSLGYGLGERRSQYDVWHPNPLVDAQAFKGKTFVFVGVDIPAVRALFESTDPPGVVVHTVDGYATGTWMVVVGRNFRGVPPVRVAPDRPAY